MQIKRRISSIEYLPVNLALYGQCQEKNACSSLLRWRFSITYDAPNQEKLIEEVLKVFHIGNCSDLKL